jgi:hypothetical protein
MGENSFLHGGADIDCKSANSIIPNLSKNQKKISDQKGMQNSMMDYYIPENSCVSHLRMVSFCDIKVSKPQTNLNFMQDYQLEDNAYQGLVQQLNNAVEQA